MLDEWDIKSECVCCKLKLASAIRRILGHVVGSCSCYHLISAKCYVVNMR